MNRLLCGVFASLGLLLSAAALRADDKPEHKLPANDREFVAHMANCGHAEVKLSELAEKRAANEKVKEFAARMVKDHTQANEKLAEAAKEQKIAVAAGFDKDKRDLHMKLSNAQGEEFDRAFMDMQVKDHEKAVHLLESYSEKAMDPAIKKWIEETLPHVKEHLKLAKEINEGLSKK